MLHPLRRQIEQLKPLLTEILNHAALVMPGEARVKRRRRDLSLLQACHLILHERDERRNDQGQPGQEGRRQLIAERFTLAGRHDRHRIAPSQHGANDLLLARPKLRKPELFAELSSQIIHGEVNREKEMVVKRVCERSIDDCLTAGKLDESTPRRMLKKAVQQGRSELSLYNG